MQNNDGSNVAAIITAVLEGIASIIGAICLGVFFCGTGWLPWKK